MNNLASVIDHTLLKPDATDQDILSVCKEANKHKFASVCIPPIHVPVAKRNTDEDVKVCTVVGFPFGYEPTISKIATISKAVEDGVDEVDVVVNISKVKNGDWSYIENEVDQLVTVANHKGGKVLKLIFEIAYLNKDEISRLCEICNIYEVNFAKTSTGYAHSGADLDTVTLMKSLLNEKVKIKASGGIRTKRQAKAYLKAGADRIGASKSVEIVK